VPLKYQAVIDIGKISVVWGEASVPTPAVKTNWRWCPAIVFHLGIVEIEDLSSGRERKSA
jgi:hypothetical protein